MPPIPVDPIARSIGDYQKAYMESGFETVQAEFRKRLLLELLNRLQPRRILEVGCAMDTLANHWNAADSFVIVEPGAAFAAEARRTTAGIGHVTVLEDTFEAAPLTGPFDLILLSGLLHEVVDCDAFLATAKALCGPETVVHVNVPNAHSFHRLLALEMGLIETVTELSPLQNTLQQHRTFTLDSLGQLAYSQGFKVVDSGSFFVKPFTHGQMETLKNDGFLTPAMLEGLWGMSRHLPGLGSEIYLNLRLDDAPP